MAKSKNAQKSWDLRKISDLATSPPITHPNQTKTYLFCQTNCGSFKTLNSSILNPFRPRKSRWKRIFAGKNNATANSQKYVANRTWSTAGPSAICKTHAHARAKLKPLNHGLLWRVRGLSYIPGVFTKYHISNKV